MHILRKIWYYNIQSPVQSFRGKNLDFPFCTIPTVSLYESMVFSYIQALYEREAEGALLRKKGFSPLL